MTSRPLPPGVHPSIQGMIEGLHRNLDAANQQILKQGEIIDLLVDALGPAGEEVFEMIAQQVDGD
jgi:hypothetical protein